MWQEYNHMWCWYCIMWGWYHQMWEKIKEPPNMKKVQSHMMLILHNVRMVPSNVMFWYLDIAGCLLVSIVRTQKKKRGYYRITPYNVNHIYSRKKKIMSNKRYIRIFLYSNVENSSIMYTTKDPSVSICLNVTRPQ